MNVITPKAYAIVIKGNKVLLIKRAHTGCYDGYWYLPAGRVEPGEAPEAAAIREAQEEVGIEIKPKFVSSVYAKVPNVQDASKEAYVDLCFFFDGSEYLGSPTNCEPKKHSEIKWFPIDQLPNPIVPVVEHGLECYQHNIPYKEFGF